MTFMMHQEKKLKHYPIQLEKLKALALTGLSSHVLYGTICMMNQGKSIKRFQTQLVR